MPFARPTYKELNERVKTDIETGLETGKLLRRSTLGYLAEAYAGAAHGLHGHLQWNYRQLFPDTAEKENLVRWSSIWGISRKAAVFAKGNVIFTGNDTTTIPQGTILKRADGLTFSTDTSAIIASGSTTVPVTAISAGEASNTDAGVLISIESPIVGIDTQTTVGAAGVSGGSDEESDDLLRNRLLDRIQTPPHGGNKDDYRFWALEVQNVTRAFVTPLWGGAGTVAVYIVDDNSDDAPIPEAATVTAAQEYLNTVRPVTADVTVFAPAKKILDFNISLTPDTTETRATVEANLKDLISREAKPGGNILISTIREAVSQAAGETDNTVNSPISNVTSNTGEIIVFGTIAWT